MTRTPSILAVAALLAACQPSDLRPVQPAGDLPSSAEIIEGEVVISADVPASLQEELGIAQLDFDSDLGAGLYLAGADTNLLAIQAALKADFADVVVESNLAAKSFASYDDAYYDLQWNIPMLGMEQAWDFNTGAGIIVAVIDSGVSKAGEDTPVNFVDGIDYVDGGTPEDENGHGTHVAGTIAQASGNGLGTVGIAPDATLLAIRALDEYGGGSMYNVASAITSAVNSGADVINLSLGTPSSMSTVSSAIANAVSKGVVVVAASGNEYAGTVSYPAAYPGVISVGAVGADSKVAAYSNGGTALDVVAPGGNLALDSNKDGYADGILQETFEGGSWGYLFFEGTSMASPHVAGIAALLLAEGADPFEIEGILRSTATDLNAKGFDTRAGYGLVDPVAALEAVANAATPVEEPPAPGDVTAPTISAVTGTRTATKMDLYWTTNEPTTTTVTFDTYGTFSDGGALVTSHYMSFTIDRYTTYTFTLEALDAAGNKGTSGKWVMYP